MATFFDVDVNFSWWHQRMVWTIFDTQQLGVRLNFDIDVKSAIQTDEVEVDVTQCEHRFSWMLYPYQNVNMPWIHPWTQLWDPSSVCAAVSQRDLMQNCESQRWSDRRVESTRSDVSAAMWNSWDRVSELWATIRSSYQNSQDHHELLGWHLNFRDFRCQPESSSDWWLREFISAPIKLIDC